MYRRERRSPLLRIDLQISFIMFFRSDFYYGHYYLSGEELKVILCDQGLSIELDWDEIRWDSRDQLIQFIREKRKGDQWKLLTLT